MQSILVSRCFFQTPETGGVEYNFKQHFFCCLKRSEFKYNAPRSIVMNQTFDVIVVGGGHAGVEAAAAAARMGQKNIINSVY